MTESQSPQASKRFRPAVNVRWAKLLKGQPPFIRRKKAKGKYAVGVRYERQVHEYLALLALSRTFDYIESPWIEYEDENGKRWCQPDALMVSDNAVAIVEVKYQHIADAWWQLVHLYRPVVSVLYPRHRPICLLEIVHWFDPKTAWPEKFSLTDSPLRIPQANKVAVHIFNPKRPGRCPESGLSLPGHQGSESAGQAVSGGGRA